MGRPSRTSDQFIVRLPDGMRERIKAAADKNNRSMNAEVVATLEEAYPEDNFSFDAFWQEWIVPIVQEERPGARAKLLELANSVIRRRDEDMAVWIEKGEGGRHNVVFGYATARFTTPLPSADKSSAAAEKAPVKVPTSSPIASPKRTSDGKIVIRRQKKKD